MTLMLKYLPDSFKTVLFFFFQFSCLLAIQTLLSLTIGSSSLSFFSPLFLFSPGSLRLFCEAGLVRWGWEDACICQTVTKMYWWKSLVEDCIFTTKPEGILEPVPWPWQFFVGGKRVMKVFFYLSRWGWGRDERDRSQLPSVLPVPLHAETHPG